MGAFYVWLMDFNRNRLIPAYFDWKPLWKWTLIYWTSSASEWPSIAAEKYNDRSHAITATNVNRVLSAGRQVVSRISAKCYSLIQIQIGIRYWFFISRRNGFHLSSFERCDLHSLAKQLPPSLPYNRAQDSNEPHATGSEKGDFGFCLFCCSLSLCFFVFWSINCQSHVFPCHTRHSHDEANWK